MAKNFFLICVLLAGLILVISYWRGKRPPRPSWNLAPAPADIKEPEEEVYSPGDSKAVTEIAPIVLEKIKRDSRVPPP